MKISKFATLAIVMLSIWAPLVFGEANSDLDEVIIFNELMEYRHSNLLDMADGVKHSDRTSYKESIGVAFEYSQALNHLEDLIWARSSFGDCEHIGELNDRLKFRVEWIIKTIEINIEYMNHLLAGIETPGVLSEGTALRDDLKSLNEFLERI